MKKQYSKKGRVVDILDSRNFIGRGNLLGLLSNDPYTHERVLRAALTGTAAILAAD